MSTYNWTDGEIVNAQKLNAYGDGIDQAREEILNATANPPKIQNGTWWTWDTATNTYKNTNVPATGQVSVTAEYQVSDSGTSVPTGTWSQTIPTLVKGKYLWTRNTFNDGTVAYSVSYNGVDGSGAVYSVNGEVGNVEINTNKIGAETNKNLLDNPFFTINQRGNSVYPAGAASYTVDRWRKSAPCEVTVLSDGVDVKFTESNPSSFGLGFWEIVDVSKYVGETITMSVWTTGATDLYARLRFVDSSDSFIRTDAIDTLIDGISTKTVIVPSNAAHVWLQIGNKPNNAAGSTIKIKACKLEIGPVSTLALDHEPNYATELLKCQKYYYCIRMANNSTRAIGAGFFSGTTSARLFVPCPTEFRTTPTVTKTGDIVIVGNGSTYSWNSVTVSSGKGNIVALIVGLTSAQSNTAAILRISSITDALEFSADL